MRKKIVAGNGKMNTNREKAVQLARAVVEGLGAENRVVVVGCPAFPYLDVVGAVFKGSPVLLGAQNLYPAKEGAFTGEVSASMLLDCGCTYVIVGHSERRHILGEKDDFINKKVKFALESGLSVILCVGETLAERQANQTEKVLDTQISAGLAGVPAASMAKVVVAYEPVWAIGTGHNATPEQAQAAHAFLRRRVGEMLGTEVANNLVIQYGGSVKPDNAAELMKQPDVDGALVGGASLNAEQFLAIVRAALP